MRKKRRRRNFLRRRGIILSVAQAFLCLKAESDRFSRRGRPDIRGGGAEHHRVRCVLRLEQHHRGLQILNDPENAGGVRAVPQSDGAVGDGYLLRGVNRTFSNSAEASAVWR